MNQSPRIITGIYKGAKLEVPEGTRPVTDRVKTYIFDKLGDSVENSVVLDIFAGSGNLGIESLSRGASYVTFIESSTQACKIIKQNLNRLNIPNSFYEVECLDYKDLERDSQPTIIFIDPPFSVENKVDFLKITNLASKQSLLVFKLSKDFDSNNLKSFVNIIEEKEIGENKVLFAALV